MEVPQANGELTAPTIAALQAKLAVFEAELERTRVELKRTRVERDYFEMRYKAQLKRLYGSTSEQWSSKQEDLFFNEAEALAHEPAASQVRVGAHAKRKGGRRPLDASLPREVVRHELAASERVCAHDGARLEPIGVEVSEQLDIVPAVVRVLRHERVKYGCPCCRQGVVTAAGPRRLVPKGVLSEASLAWVVTAKYQDALPLYRQAGILKRFGGELSRGTLAANVMRAGMAVQPLINLLRERLLEAVVVHGDETVVQVLKEPGRAAQTKSWLWVQCTGSGPPVRLFTYAPSRSAKTAVGLYADARGALMTDGYEAYAAVAAAHGLVHLGCWAHARRYVFEAEAGIPKDARSAEQPATRLLALIGELYAVETEARTLTPNARLDQRQARSRPVVAAIEAMVLAHLHDVLPQSLLGKALHYLHQQWPKLLRFLDDDRYPLDNNLAENAIRPFVVGRKNWLFSDTVRGAQASANLYSLIETAKANGLEPYHYLRHVFERLPQADSVDDIERLLPWNVDPDQPGYQT